MNSETYSNLKNAATAELFTTKDQDQSAGAKKAIAKELLRMTEAQEVNILSDEEERMLRAFRRFKLGCRPGSVFKWQTVPTPAEDRPVIHTDTALIQDPQEVR